MINFLKLLVLKYRFKNKMKKQSSRIEIKCINETLTKLKDIIVNSSATVGFQLVMFDIINCIMLLF